jgi:phosphoglycolate phosphatase
MASTPFVLFDMDGTLLDTRRDIARAANAARQELGLPPMTLEEVIMAVGDGVDLFVSRVTYSQTDGRFSAARRIFLRHYEANVIGETVPYEGILPLLNELMSRDVPMAKVSNKPAKLVDMLVRHFKWESFFKTWLGGDSAAKAKPSHLPLFLARQQAGLSASHPIVMVGDGSQDILAAKAAGCEAVWCSWGFNAAPIADYPVRTIDHPRELLLTITKP